MKTFSDRCDSVEVTPYSTLMFWRLILPLVMVIAHLSGLETELSPKIETAGSHGYLCPFMAISTRRLAIR
jgi:hypothetical protein